MQVPAPPFKPADFDDFWLDTLNRLAIIPHAVRIEQSQPLADDLQLRELSFQSWQDGRIQAYLLQHKGDAPRPLVVYTHGYYGEYEVVRQWAEQGLDVFGFDTRGFGRSKEAVAEIHPDGWILTGIESPEHAILRGAICDYYRAVDIARQLLTKPPLRTLFYGFSFGGAMALVGDALRQDADFVAAGVPSFGWMAGRRQLVGLGSGKEVNDYLAHHPRLDETVMQTLAYFDTANFADRVQAPTLIGLGLKDVVVPAATVRAISDRLHCPNLIREFPVSHSNQKEEAQWQKFEAEWIGLATTGVWPKM
jgi:cephalosporin-C deacetylase